MLGEHIYDQFTDMTGEKQTMRGTYLIPVSYSNHPTPPPLINPCVTLRDKHV